MSRLQRLRKLRKMSPDELRARAARALTRKRERWAYRLGWRNGRADSPVSNGEFGTTAGSLLRMAREMVPGAALAQVAQLRRDDSPLYRSLAERAEARARRILEGKLHLLGRDIALPDQPNWHRDPLSEHEWPRTFYADLHLYELPPPADVKYVWELNRHQFLVELARGWLFHRNHACAERVRNLLLRWIDENPLYEGVNWTSAVEVAVRSLSWLWALATLSDWPEWSGSDERRIACSLADHAQYIARHFSFYSSPYNHLIGEATALYLLGRWLRGHKRASRWERLGREVLERHGPRQCYEDGFGVEQATGYHFFTLGFLSQAVVAARHDGRPLEAVERVLPRAFEAGAAFRQPDGRWPAVGDVDSARSIPVMPDDFWDFRGLCNLGAVLFDVPALKRTADGPGEELYWLLGVQGPRQWERLAKGRPARATVLRDSGYALARSHDDARSDWMLFDGGPIAAGLYSDATPSTAHGHADALQVLLFLGGRRVTTDPGIPFYFGRRDWVDHFRAAAAHNTLEVEGLPVARHAGRLAWSHVADRPELDANLSDDAWLARGRLELGGRATIERNVLVVPGLGAWIADFVQNDRPRGVSWYWQLGSSACDLRSRSDRIEVGCGSFGLTVSARDTVLTAHVDEPAPEGPIARVSNGYGECSPAVRLAIQAVPAEELVALTHFGSTHVPVAVEVYGRRLRGASAETLPMNRDAPHADVRWWLATADGLVCFCARPAERPDDHWQRLAGAGGWPVYRATFAVEPHVEPSRRASPTLSPLGERVG